MRFFAACALACLAAVGLAQPKETVHLRFVVWDGDEGLPVIRRAVRSFEEAHPHIKVKLEGVQRNYQEKLLAQVAANSAPDVAMMDMSNFQRFATRDALLPLNQFFDRVPGFNIEEYYKPLVDAHSYEGTVYVLPRDIAPIGIIYYNKPAFDEAGIPYPDGTWTWDFEPRPELREKCFTWVMDQLTKKDARGKTTRWGFSAGWIGWFIDTCVFSLGGRYADDPDHPTKVLYDTEPVRQGYRFVADACLKHGWVPSPMQLSSEIQSTARQLFTQGKVAMFQSGIWDVPAINKELIPGQPGYFEWDIALAPGFKDGTRGAPTGGSGYCIFKQTKHPEEAWLLTEWMAGRPGMEEMAKVGYAQPGIEAVALSEPWNVGPNTPPEMSTPRNRIATHYAVPYVVFNPRWGHWTEVSNLATSAMDSVWSGATDVDSALTLGNRRAQARLDVLREEEKLPPMNWWIGGAFGLALAAALVFWVYMPERGQRRTSKQKHENRVAYLFISPWIIGMVAFTLGPMILSLLMSFTDWDIIRPALWRGVKNYTEASTVDPRFWQSLIVTSIYTVVAVPLGLITSLALALLLNVKVKGMPLYRTMYYLPSLASGVATALIWRKVFQPDGLLNAMLYGPSGEGLLPGLGAVLNWVSPGQPINWLGNDKTALAALILMSVWGAGGAMVILLAGLQGIPQFYYEAATVDGAGPWTRFKSITVPLLSPALLFCLITGFIGSFQVFTQAFIMTQGGPDGATLFYMLHLYNNAFLSLRMGYASALAWVLFFVILIFTLIQLRLSKFVYYEADAKS
ncbi:MAG: extracellular solute-binding protein [Fimbriimonadaceae bacterium]